MVIEEGDDVADVAAAVGAERGTTYVLIGQPPPRTGVARFRESLSEQLIRRMPGVDVRIVADRARLGRGRTMNRILFPFVGTVLPERTLEATLRLAKSQHATLMPAYIALVPRTLSLEAPLGGECDSALALLEVIEQRAAREGVEVDSRIVRGRTTRQAIAELMDEEQFDALGDPGTLPSERWARPRRRRLGAGDRPERGPRATPGAGPPNEHRLTGGERSPAEPDPRQRGVARPTTFARGIGAVALGPPPVERQGSADDPASRSWVAVGDGRGSDDRDRGGNRGRVRRPGDGGDVLRAVLQRGRGSGDRGPFERFGNESVFTLADGCGNVNGLRVSHNGGTPATEGAVGRFLAERPDGLTVQSIAYRARGERAGGYFPQVVGTTAGDGIGIVNGDQKLDGSFKDYRVTGDLRRFGIQLICQTGKSGCGPDPSSPPSAGLKDVTYSLTDPTAPAVSITGGTLLEGAVQTGCAGAQLRRQRRGLGSATRGRGGQRKARRRDEQRLQARRQRRPVVPSLSGVEVGLDQARHGLEAVAQRA